MILWDLSDSHEGIIGLILKKKLFVMLQCT